LRAFHTAKSFEVHTKDKGLSWNLKAHALRINKHPNHPIIRDLPVKRTVCPE
jgi:hypothetical protein